MSAPLLEEVFKTSGVPTFTFVEPSLTAMNNLAQTLKAQGDLAGARKLQEQVLEASRRLLGDEHPDTTISAWNLIQTLLKKGDTDAAERVGAENLHWFSMVISRHSPGTSRRSGRCSRKANLNRNAPHPIRGSFGKVIAIRLG